MKQGVITTLTLYPGTVWTAEGRFAADALKVSVAWTTNSEGAQHPSLVSIHEVHELNIVGRRHINDTRFALRRAAEQLAKEGITFAHEGELYTVMPPHVRVSPRFRIRAFVLDDPKLGPFSGENFVSNE